MARLFSIELQQAERRQLLQIARDSIRHGLEGGESLRLSLAELPTALHSRLGVFVTLKQRERLRGCIGSMQSDDPLAQSVADNAWGAAFRDPRFPRLEPDEFDETGIEISLLSPMVPLVAASRDELLERLRPGRDGLLLEDGRHRSTFLPKVWEQLPTPDSFLEHLLAKAGLPADHWSPTLRLQRYETVCFSEA